MFQLKIQTVLSVSDHFSLSESKAASLLIQMVTEPALPSWQVLKYTTKHVVFKTVSAST